MSVTIHALSREAFLELIEAPQHDRVIESSSHTSTYPEQGGRHITYENTVFSITSDFVNFFGNPDELQTYLNDQGFAGTVQTVTLFDTADVSVTALAEMDTQVLFVTVNEKLSDQNYVYRVYDAEQFRNDYLPEDGSLYVFDEYVETELPVTMYHGTASVPFLETVHALGGEIERGDNDVVTIRVKDRQFTLDLAEPTLYEDDESCNFLYEIVGGTVIVRRQGDDVTVDYNTLQAALNLIGYSVRTRLDHDTDSVCVVEVLDTAMYDDLLSEYAALAEYRLAEDFQERWNSGEFFEIPTGVALAYESEDDETVPLKGRWSNMIVEMADSTTTDVSDFGYLFDDIDGDNTAELFWVKKDGSILAVFTYYEDHVVLMDAFWPCYRGVLTEGHLYTRGSGGATLTRFAVRMLFGAEWYPVAEFGIDGWNEELDEPLYYEVIDGTQQLIERTRFEVLQTRWPFEQSAWWQSLDVIPLA